MFIRHRQLLAAAAGLFAAAALSGCNTVADVWENTDDYVPYFLQPYRADVHQGNLVTSEMALQLEKGMTDAQVQFLLGVPLVKDQFHADRWDYVYFLLRGDGERQLRKLTVFFDKDRRVDYWVSDPLPDEEQADQLILGNIKTFEPRAPRVEPKILPNSSAEATNAEGRTPPSEDAHQSADRAAP